MKLVLLLVILATTAYTQNLQELVGQYDISSQCDSWTCDRTSYGDSSNNFCCPLNGNSGSIQYNSFNNYYSISFKTYNMFWADGYFETVFTTKSVQDEGNGNQINIPMNDGYVMTIIPCYNKAETMSVCSNNPQYPQIAVFKTRPNSNGTSSCAFVMNKIL